MVRYFFIHGPTGSTWEVSDPVRWALDHRDEAILAPARDRLLTLTTADGDRILRLVVRRCRLTLVELRGERVLVHFWGPESQADLRPFFKLHGLARPGVEVVMLWRKREWVWSKRGDDFLFGEPHAGFPWEAYRQEWDRRHEQDEDWSPAPEALTNFGWPGVEPPLIPWAVLKWLWVHERTQPCPNCDTPTLTVRLWHRRRPWVGGLNSYLTRGCFECRRLFKQDYPGDVLEWVLGNLDRRLWPTHLRLFRRYDLTAEYAAALGRLGDGGAGGETA